jgi:lipid II:glycine glycyltransferase (peptidoglycan interpeptide bridge formation enzyme)
MKIVEAKASFKSLWESLNQDSPYSSFLQSYGWGDFQIAEQLKTFRLAVEDSMLSGGFTSKTKILGLAQVFKHPLPWNKSYLYIPHGPITVEGEMKVKVTEILISKLKEIAKKENSAFVLMEPKQNFDEIPFFSLSSKHIQTETTLILDISKTKTEIMARMKSKTRYNVRLAKRKGIKIEVSKNLEDINIFLKLAKTTSERDSFRLHPDEYYRSMLDILSRDGTAELLLAKYKNRYIAAILVVYYGKMATYLHGASDNNYRNIMAPHLLQWKAIKQARQRGCTFYDFWGVTKDPDPNHHWAGFTRFKLGFAPNTPITEYPGPYEYVFRPLDAFLYRTSQKLLGRR